MRRGEKKKRADRDNVQNLIIGKIKCKDFENRKSTHILRVSREGKNSATKTEILCNQDLNDFKVLSFDARKPPEEFSGCERCKQLFKELNASKSLLTALE